jgi:hypothetical protein
MTTITTTTDTTTTTAAAVIAQRDKALAAGARADGLLLKAACAWWTALEVEATTTYEAILSQAPDMDNTRDVQRVAYLGMIVAEHGMPKAIKRGEVDRLLKTLGGILGASKFGGGTGSIRAAVEEAVDADDAIEAIRALSARVNKARREAGTTTTGGSVTPPPTPTVKPRGNAALIADAIADIARVDAATLTEAETLALASLVQSIAALGKAYTSRAA